MNQRGVKHSGWSEYWAWPLVLPCKGYFSQILINTAWIKGPVALPWASCWPRGGSVGALGGCRGSLRGPRQASRRLQPGPECAASFSETPKGRCVRGWGPPGTSCGAPGVLWSASGASGVSLGGCWRILWVSCDPEGPRQVAGGPRRARTALQALRESPRGAPRSLGGKLSGCSVVAWGVRWGSRFLFAFGSLG